MGLKTYTPVTPLSLGVRMLINCDIGERGVAHKIDDALMRHIDIANIACGGHAGDKDSVQYYMNLAQECKVKISTHLSYPDVKNFGRVVLNLAEKELLNALDLQYSLMCEVKTLKFHGALYNEANLNENLSLSLSRWAKSAGIKEVLTPFNSCLAKACEEEGLILLHEVFLDRKYIYEDNVLKLSPRSKPNALITSLHEAKIQYENFLEGKIKIKGRVHILKVDTGCIHSDSSTALEMAKILCSH